jgi:hypothetical protein
MSIDTFIVDAKRQEAKKKRLGTCWHRNEAWGAAGVFVGIVTQFDLLALYSYCTVNCNA